MLCLRARDGLLSFEPPLLFQVNEGTNVVLQHNIVAGFERVAYRIDGEPCPGMLEVSLNYKLKIRGKFL